jgi:hypothetical protein
MKSINILDIPEDPELLAHQLARQNFRVHFFVVVFDAGAESAHVVFLVVQELADYVLELVGER